jgi:trimethylamine:corrinoid methyltransferase-like protein
MRATNVTFPVKVLSDGDVAKIYQGSVEVLENTGVQFEDRQMLTLLEEKGCRVDHKSQRLQRLLIPKPA